MANPADAAGATGGWAADADADVGPGPGPDAGGLGHALPFAVSLALPALVAVGAARGGWTLVLVPAFAWVAATIVDALVPPDANPPVRGGEGGALVWHRALTWIWVPAQFAMIYGALWAATGGGALSGWEAVGLMAGVGVASGGVGITYAHELIHQPGRGERRLGDLLLASVLYGHFASEHVLGHHVHVCTARDPATARHGEGFWRFLARVLPGSLASSWRIEAGRLARRGRGRASLANPFWRYGALAAGCLAAAWAIGGWAGIGLFAVQAGVAVIQLEAVNYVEHYGLVRVAGPDGRPERVAGRHSWNVPRAFTNWLLINLQRHSDHHIHPARRYPELESLPASAAPQLPFGYPVMVGLALWPPLWRRVMDRRVLAWRRRWYPGLPPEAFRLV